MTATQTLRTAALLLAAAALAAVPAAAQHHDHHPPAAAESGGHSGHGDHGDHAASGAEAGDPHAAHRAMLAAGDDAGSQRLADGVSIPDVEVLDQNGEPVHFYSDLVAGKTVAMNFVFTTCTTICPPMGANFGRLQKELGDRLGRDVHLISVSVDPVTDTPARMKAWGEKFGAGPGWSLITGERAEVTRLLKALQVFTADIREHSPVVLIGNDATGEWTRAYGLAPPAKLAELALAATAEGDQTKGGR